MALSSSSSDDDEADDDDDADDDDKYDAEYDADDNDDDEDFHQMHLHGGRHHLKNHDDRIGPEAAVTSKFGPSANPPPMKAKK